MSTQWLKRWLLLIVVLIASSCSSHSRKFITIPNSVPGHIVILREGSTAEDAQLLSKELSRKYGGEVKQVYTQLPVGFALEGLTDRQARQISKDKRVKYVVQNSLGRAQANLGTTLWNLDRIDQRVDFDARDGLYKYVTSGSGVIIWVVDTGVRATHDELTGRTSNEADVTGSGYNFDCNGHGTQVASVAAGAKRGVARGATIKAVKAIGNVGVPKDPCSGFIDAVNARAGIDYVANHATARGIVVLSFSFDFDEPQVNAAVQALISTKGQVVVVAAGNGSKDAQNTSPAKVPEALTVAGMSWEQPTPGVYVDIQTIDSNFGSVIDLYAPGEGISVADYGSDQAYTTKSGTSFAAPAVAGAAALYLENNPSASVSDIVRAITDGATKNQISNPGLGTPNRLLFTDLSPKEEWSTQIGDPAVNEQGRSIVVDTAGAVYTTGIRTESGMPASYFVAKYSATGAQLWYRITPGLTETTAHSIAIAPSSVVVGGRRKLDPVAPGPGNANGFIEFLEPTSGNSINWLTFDTPGDDGVDAVTVGSDGMVYVVGTTTGSFTGFSNQGGTDVFVAKASSTGVISWVKQFGSLGDDSGGGLITLGSNTIYVVVTGTAAGALPNSSTNPTPNPYGGGKDYFIATFESKMPPGPDGTNLYIKEFGASGDDEATAVAIDLSDNIYVVGHTTGSLSGSNAGGADVFLQKLDFQGNNVWIQQLGTAMEDRPGSGGSISVATYGLTPSQSNSNDIFIGGWTGGSPQRFGVGREDAFLAKYDSFGNLRWVKHWETVGSETYEGLFLYSNGLGQGQSGFVGVVGSRGLYPSLYPGISDAIVRMYLAY